MTDLHDRELDPGSRAELPTATAPIEPAVSRGIPEGPIGPVTPETPWYKKPMAKVAAGALALAAAVGLGASLGGSDSDSDNSEIPVVEPRRDNPEQPTNSETGAEETTSEITEVAQLPAELFTYSDVVAEQVQTTIENNESENAESIPAEDRIFSMWRGTVMFETIDDEGNPIFVRLNNPIEVVADDVSGEHDQVALWVGYHAPSGQYITVERGYRDTEGSTDYNSGDDHRIWHWSTQDNSNSGQEVTGSPTAVRDAGLELVDNFNQILRGDESTVISSVQVFSDPNEALLGLNSIMDLGNSIVHRDNEEIRTSGSGS